eukprot:g13355.t1
MVYSSKASSDADDADFVLADVGKIFSAADGGTLVDLKGRRPVYRLRVQQPATGFLALCGFEALQFRLQPYTLNHLLRARFDEEQPTSPGLAHRPLQFRTGGSTTWDYGTGHHCASSAGTARTGDPPYFYELRFIDGVAREVDWIRVWNQKDTDTPERVAATEFYVDDDAEKLFKLPGFIGAEGAGDTGETGTLLKVGRTLTRFRIQGNTAPNKAVHLCGIHVYGPGEIPSNNANKASWNVFYVDGGSTELVGAVDASGAKGDKGLWVEIAKKFERVRIESDHNSNHVCLGGILIHGNPAPFRPLEHSNTTVKTRFLPKKTFLTQCAAARNESLLATPPAGAHADYPERSIKPAYAGGPDSPGGSEDPSKILSMKMPRQNAVDSYDAKYYPHIGFGVPGAGTGPGGFPHSAPHYGGVLHRPVGQEAAAADSEFYWHGVETTTEPTEAVVPLMRMVEPVTTLNMHSPFAQRHGSDPLPAIWSSWGQVVSINNLYCW